eukprot:GEMP01021171.1.p1 GENE.GEMP01021171.1~~GEMP01021171.1.p1  ORF type:complete len:111 (-),score=3.21 GEMP01021171.1:337-669(-)
MYAIHYRVSVENKESRRDKKNAFLLILKACLWERRFLLLVLGEKIFPPKDPVRCARGQLSLLSLKRAEKWYSIGYNSGKKKLCRMCFYLFNVQQKESGERGKCGNTRGGV